MAGAARAGTGITPGHEPARFPGYDVLAQRPVWDDVTRTVVDERVAPAHDVRFFEAAEVPVVRALLDRLLAQDTEPRVPVLEMIDDRLYTGCGDGYRYENLPEDAEAWRRSIAGLERDARERGATSFAALDRAAQMDVVERVQKFDDDWHGMPAARVFELWMRYACAAFYSHPWAWNEIGFGGPAYPRGYGNLGLDRRESWERPERDAIDPVSWSRRADAVKRVHARREPPS